MKVLLGTTVGDAPANVQTELRLRLYEIADSLETIPKGGSLWRSMTLSGFLLDVGSWRFEYRIDDAGNRLVVTAALFKQT